MTIDTLTPGVIAQTSAATVSLLPLLARFSLRVRESERAALAKAIGLDLPLKIGARAKAGGVEVLCLGPDEWVLITDDAPRLRDACAGIQRQAPHSLVEISDRELSFLIEGPKAAELLTLGCPRNIDRIADGEGRRTVFDGATVILWRDGANRFRFDVWRSFAPHIVALLETGCAELGVEYSD